MSDATGVPTWLKPVDTRAERALGAGAGEGDEQLDALGGDGERMGDAHRREDVVAGLRVEPLAADVNSDLTGDHVERLVRVMMDVGRCSGAAVVANDQLDEPARPSRRRLP